VTPLREAPGGSYFPGRRGQHQRNGGGTAFRPMKVDLG
jgi:hypothetical protein